MSDLVSVQEGLPVRVGGVSSSTGLPDYFADVNSGGSLQVAGQGVAGTPAGGVVSIQGVTSGTAVPVSQSGAWTSAVTQSTSPWVTKDQADGPVTPGTAASFSELIGGQFNTALPTLTNTQQSAIQLDSSGRIIIRPLTSADVVSAVQSGTWTTGRTWTLASGTDSVSVVQSTSPWVTKDQSDGPVTPGTVASFSQLMGGQYNSTLPTLTTAQQSAIQLDSSGRLIISPTTSASIVTVSNFPTTVDTNYGTVGANTIRTASQIGNATGAASFGAGVTGAQTLRVAANTYDGVGNAITSSSNGYAAQQLLNVQVPNTSVAPVALGALNATVSVAMAGLQTVGFQMAAGTFIGTVTPQYSIDGGTSWQGCSFLNTSTGNITSSYTFTASNTLTILGVIPGGGATNVRVIVTAYTSGTASCILSASEALSATSQPGSVFGSGTIAALNQTVVATTAGYGSAYFNISGTWVGSITFQAHNGDYNWVNIYVYFASTGSYASSSTTINTTAQLNCAGYFQVRAIATAWTSGTATVSWDAAAYPHQIQIYNPNSAANVLVQAYNFDGAGNGIGSPLDTAGTSLYTIKPDASATGTLGALNAIVNLPINDVSSAYALISGTWVGTIQFQGSVNGTNFVPLEAVQGGPTNAYSTAGFTTNGGVRIALPAGFTSIQAVMTAYTSGTATVIINASAAPANVEVVQFNASNLNILGNAAVTTSAPTYSTATNQPLSLKTTGDLRVDSVIADGYLATIATNTGASATDFTTIGTITALNGSVSVYGQGVYTVTASITGTWVGTLVMEGQAADSNWYGLEIYQPGSNPTAFTTTITANGLYAVVGGGFLNIRVRASAYTSGTVNVGLDGSLAQQSILAGQLGTWTSVVTQSTASNLNAQVVGNVASGSADSGNAVKMGGVYNTTNPTLTTGQRGDLQLDAKSRLEIIDSANLGTGTQGALSVTTTATEIRVGASRLAGRSTITAFNNGSQTIYWGYSSGVTTTTGTPLVQNQVGSWKVGDQQSVYLIATSGTQNVRITEV